MPRFPVLKARELAEIPESLGFILVRQRGSHRRYRHPDGRGATVPFHGASDISRSLLRQICAEIGMSVEDFLKHRD